MKLKKEYKYLIVLIIVLILSIIIYRHLFIYSYSLNRRWDLNLSSNYKESIVVKEKDNYIGKGISYRVFKYNDIDKNTWCIKFTNKDNSTKYYNKYSECISDYLKYIDVDDYKCSNCMYYYKNINNNELMLILDKNKKLLYVIENIL